MIARRKIQKILSYFGLLFLGLLVAVGGLFLYMSHTTDGHKNDVVDVVFHYVRSSDLSGYILEGRSVSELGELVSCIGEDNSVTVYYADVTYSTASLECSFKGGVGKLEAKLMLLDDGRWVVDRMTFRDIHFGN